MSIEKQAAETLLRAIHAGQKIDELSLAAPAIVIPKDYEVASLEQYLSAPTRIKQHVKITDVASFIAYVNRFKNTDTTIFANEANGEFTAIIDYHAPEDAQWGDHRAQLKLVETNEWKVWKAENKKTKSQTEFAQFIEDNLKDIVEPSAAHMLEVSRSLDAVKSTDFSSSVRLDNGQVQFKYSENISGCAQQGRVTVPERFTLGLALFEGDIKYQVEARLRYRIHDGGKLSMWFDLYRPHDTHREVIKAISESIASSLELPLVIGSPA